jgi:hypothetical protein
MKQDVLALSLGLALGAGGATMAGARSAYAISCDALPNAANPDAGAPPVVYIEGSTGSAPFITQLQQVLSIDPDPINLVYIGDGSCVASKNFFGGSPISASPLPTYYTGPSSKALNCDLASPAPVTDIAVSDVYAPSCGNLPGGVLPPNIADFPGPVQPMLFAVPKASNEHAISANAAYFVFGFGSASGVSPWTVNSSIYRRDPSSGTQALMSVATGIPLTQWAGVDATTLPANVNAGYSGTTAVVNALETDPNPSQAIAIFSATNLDVSKVSVLAYKDRDQSCGYYPDSTPTARDKANVRDGHYALWGPMHFFTYVDEHGVPQRHEVQRIISYITGTLAAPGGLDLVQIEALSNLVPQCAMRVWRTVEMGPLMSYAVPSCGCYFDYVATGQSSCQRCTMQSDCPASAPVCNLNYPLGYCETQ